MTIVNPIELMPLIVSNVVDAAEGIRSFELVHPEGAELPQFTPGSHVTVKVPNQELRKYSLCNSAEERHRYVITVKRDAEGRGGSMSLHDVCKAGDVLPTSAPDNAFALVDKAASYLFIAGGIGITPIMSMIRSFGELPPAPWKLLYLTRSAAGTAFLEELMSSEYKGKVVIHHSTGDPEGAFDLWKVLEKPSNAHVYCCGPRLLMEAVRDMTGHWPSGRIHFESFTDGTEARPDDRPFNVKVATSGEVFEVMVGQTILSVLREKAGMSLPSSCESGTCGTCKVGLLSGSADHRDMVLMPEEQSSQIMICVSRAISEELVLDL